MNSPQIQSNGDQHLPFTQTEVVYTQYTRRAAAEDAVGRAMEVRVVSYPNVVIIWQTNHQWMTRPLSEKRLSAFVTQP
jgi:hypothetical protein